MRKNFIGAAAAALFVMSGGAQAALTLDLDGGTIAGNTIQITSLDWTTTSFLAKGGNTAIANFVAGGTGSDVEFTVYTHATLTGYKDQNGVSRNLPAGYGEITVVGAFTERVTDTPTARSASFETTGSGWLEMYYSRAANSRDITGSGFDDGKVIYRATGTTGNGALTAEGLFSNTTTPVGGAVLDQFNGNSYGTQKTVRGHGDQESIVFGSTGSTFDANFFTSGGLSTFSLLFENISIGLPFSSADPSDCFNLNQASVTNAQIAGGVSNTNTTTQCLNNHINGTYAQNFTANGNDGGYVPVVGDINGLNEDNPDFVAQSDYNSPITQQNVPEPGMLSLLGLALGAAGLITRRRKSA